VPKPALAALDVRVVPIQVRDRTHVLSLWWMASALGAQKDVRRAVAIALDRSELARGYVGGGLVASGRFLEPRLFGHSPGLEVPERNVEGARRALRALAGKPLRLAAFREYRSLAEGVATQLEAAGVRTTQVEVNATSLPAVIRDRSVDVVLLHMVSNLIGAEPCLLLDGATRRIRLAGFNDDPLKDLAARAVAEPSTARRAELYADAERRLLEMSYWIPIGYRDERRANVGVVVHGPGLQKIADPVTGRLRHVPGVLLATVSRGG
jgi:ABC-type transport system substrate-binding protein